MTFDLEVAHTIHTSAHLKSDLGVVSLALTYLNSEASWGGGNLNSEANWGGGGTSTLKLVGGGNLNSEASWGGGGPLTTYLNSEASWGGGTSYHIPQL